jgi:hypothetical protein
MARYFYHLANGTEVVLDPHGIEQASFATMQNSVLLAVRDLIKADVDRGLIDLRLRIDAADDAGVIVHSLCFKDAVSIIPDADPVRTH